MSLTTTVRTFLQWEWERANSDDGIFNDFLPYSSLHEWIPEDSVYSDVFRGFELGRLAGVKALNAVNFHTPGVTYFMSNHSRLDHSLVVGMVMEHILRRNKFSEGDVNTGIAAGLLHDIATPAWGDAVMAIDIKNLHEEAAWREFLTPAGEDVLRKHGVTPGNLDDAIRNQGLLGTILDISDRITYVCKDLFSIYTGMYVQTHEGRDYLMQFDSSHISQFTSHPIGDIYKDVFVEDGHACFASPARLERFLRARVFLHQNYYLHPSSQARDLIMGSLANHFYSLHEGTLTPNALRHMDDYYLRNEISRLYPPAKAVPGCFEFWNASYKKIDSEEAEEAVRRELESDPNTIIIGTRKIRDVNPALNYNVKHNGRIMPFSDAYPEQAADIQRTASSIAGTYMFYSKADGTEISDLLTHMKHDGLLPE